MSDENRFSSKIAPALRFVGRQVGNGAELVAQVSTAVAVATGVIAATAAMVAGVVVSLGAVTFMISNCNDTVNSMTSFGTPPELAWIAVPTIVCFGAIASWGITFSIGEKAIKAMLNSRRELSKDFFAR